MGSKEFELVGDIGFDPDIEGFDDFVTNFLEDRDTDVEDFKNWTEEDWNQAEEVWDTLSATGEEKKHENFYDYLVVFYEDGEEECYEGLREAFPDAPEEFLRLLLEVWEETLSRFVDGHDSAFIDEGKEVWTYVEARKGGYLPSLELGSHVAHVAETYEEAEDAAREYWKDMAQNDRSEFIALVGEERLTDWALGNGSFDEWLDDMARYPEETFGSEGMYGMGYISESLADRLELTYDDDDITRGWDLGINELHFCPVKFVSVVYIM